MENLDISKFVEIKDAQIPSIPEPSLFETIAALEPGLYRVIQPIAVIKDGAVFRGEQSIEEA